MGVAGRAQGRVGGGWRPMLGVATGRAVGIGRLLLIVSLLAASDAIASDRLTPAAQAAEAGRWSAASLSEPRSGMVATTVGDVAVFVGGSTVGPPSRTVDLYDRTTRQWSTATLSVGRAGPSTATVGSMIIVAGGIDTTSAASPVVDLYDTATREWSVAYLSRPWRSGEIVTVGEKALFPGPETVDVLDAQTGQVTTVQLSQPRTGILTAVVGTRVLLIGGNVQATPADTLDRAPSDTTDTAPSGAIDIFDSATGTWTTAALAQPRSEPRVAVVGDRVLIAGGDRLEESEGPGGANGKNGKPTDQVDIYDASTGDWSTARLSVARQSIAVAVVGNVALFAGGSKPGSGLWDPGFDAVDLYDATTGAWSTARLSKAERVVAAVAGSQAVFVSTSRCYEARCPHTVDVYESRTDTWRTGEIQTPTIWSPGAEYNDQQVGGTIVGVGRHAVLAGGTTTISIGAGQQYTILDPGTWARIYDSETGAWSEATLAERVYAPLARVNGSLAALAGSNDAFVRAGTGVTTTPETVSDLVNLFDSARGEWISGELSSPRRSLGVAVLGDTAIFAGGTSRDRTEQYSRQVDLYDAGTGQWSTTTFPRDLPMTSSLTSRGAGHYALYFNRYGIDTIDLLDVRTSAWSAFTLSPSRSGVAVATVGDQVLFAGGHNNVPGDDAVFATVDLFDGRTGTWSAHALSEPRDEPAAVVIGTRALIAGGWSPGRPRQGSDVVDMYDAATGTWSTTALPTLRGAPAVAAAVGTRAVFLRGGHGDIYDTATGTWTTIESVPPLIDRSSAKVVIAGTAVVVYDGAEVAVYESETGAWTTHTLAERRSDASVAVVGGEVIFAGGSNFVPSYHPLAAVDIYDSRQQAWRSGSLSAPRREPAVAVVGSRAIFAGGRSETGYSDRVDVYDAATGAWSMERLSLVRAYMVTATTGSTALFAGGTSGQGRLLDSDRVDLYEVPPGERR